jgi:hypothetical protein
MSQKSPALRLINDLLADFRDPDFIWQVVALVACLGLAFLVARWWQGRHAEGAGRLSDAGSRLAFPLTGMVLAGLAIATLSLIQSICSSWPCRCSVRWRSCVAWSSFCVRLSRGRPG